MSTDTPMPTDAPVSAGRVVLGGSTGFMGTYLLPRLRAAGREVVTISRSGADIAWGDQEAIDRAVDGASLVIGLAGKSVNCRYTAENRAAIFRSRLDTTASLSTAITRASAPPALWVNSSTATIYRHAEDRPMTESTGEIGRGFSVEVAKAWERALFADELPHTRRVALRSAIVLGHGGVLGPLRTLARLGLGGAQLDGRWPASRARRAAGTGHDVGARGGRQRFSWVHVEDVARIIDFLELHPELEGPVNAAAPNPVDNRAFMAIVRHAAGARIGPPMPRWMLELGAIGIRTETELILKSRWVLPEKLTRAGFEFVYPDLDGAVRESFGVPAVA
ncbi:TIGR01777 family oxidoreductase [Microbacterium sp. UFMG61]|uniref:TIGR01777 family oxidoreductase n=1 Tax=Microbacterium sp. UFMG61 TaxID=2745935 RepID=UPI001E3A65EA|nr:TIGR01777 family oxidoreductase [Microbacterium sp. UFMG61]